MVNMKHRERGDQITTEKLGGGGGVGGGGGAKNGALRGERER